MTASTVGIIFAISAAFCSAGSVIQTRRLTQTETTSSIVLYFSLICALAGLATWPLGWLVPTWPALAALVTVGLFVIWRERQLGLQRVRAAEGPPTGT